MTYSEKLRDPRWQKRKAEILQRDDFTCQQCFQKDQTLHVHHRIYRRGADPWDYSGDDLITLCDRCHEFEEIEREIIHEAHANRTTTDLISGAAKAILDDGEYFGGRYVEAMHELKRFFILEKSSEFNLRQITQSDKVESSRLDSIRKCHHSSLARIENFKSLMIAGLNAQMEEILKASDGKVREK